MRDATDNAVASTKSADFASALRAFRDAAAALPDAVVALDEDGRIDWFNAAANDLLGLKYPHDIGAHLTNACSARHASPNGSPTRPNRSPTCPRPPTNRGA
jgi:two-component system phosphate regulon sensor histidine kinase PhoR